MESFSKLFGSLLAFVYHCFDRIVIQGYLPLLTREAHIVHFFRDVQGIYPITKQALRKRTQEYRAICTNVLDFRARVLAISDRKGPPKGSDSDPGHGSAHPLEGRADPGSPGSRLQAHRPVGPRGQTVVSTRSSGGCFD
jgi:hypothetical protein